jgi:dethiobiotin synthetase
MTGPRHGLFITSVGTGIGKTLVTAILCHQLTGMGRKVAALKPVVSGFLQGDPASDPALILRSLGKEPTQQAIAAIAPWRFALPVSPHLAARREGRASSLEEVAAFCCEQEPGASDVLLIEGAGGVMTPIDHTQTNLDLIIRLGHPVILVTGSYLGAISHTLTALFVLHASGVGMRGIVVSESLDSTGLAETVDSLKGFAGDLFPLYALPRLTGTDEEKWRAAPPLFSLCDFVNG